MAFKSGKTDVILLDCLQYLFYGQVQVWEQGGFNPLRASEALPLVGAAVEDADGEGRFVDVGVFVMGIGAAF